MKYLLIASAVSLAAATAANAVTFQGTAVGSWTNIQGGGAITHNNNDDGPGEATLNWGNAVGTPFNNLWAFDGVGSDGDPEWSSIDDSLFKIGDFTYRNGSVSGHSFTGADLTIDLTITSPLNNAQAYSFDFDVINTPNTGGGCCADIASIVANVSSTTFMYDGEEYTLELTGFSQDFGVTVTSMFDSPEGTTATAELYARIIRPPVSEVPVPASLPLLIGGVGALTVLRRRRKAS